MDADTHKSLGQQYGVSGFPTIKVFGTNKYSPINFQGGRTADAIVEQALTQLRTIVNERLGKRGGGSTGGGGSSGGGGGSGGKDTIELTDSNFEVRPHTNSIVYSLLFQSTVLESEDMWLVEFSKSILYYWTDASGRTTD